MSNINLPNIPGKFLLRFGNSRPEAGTTRYKKPNFFTDDTFYDNQRMEHGIPSSENTDYEYESGAFFCFTVEGNTGEARTGTLEYTATTAPDEDYEGVFNVTCAWTVVQEGHYEPGPEPGDTLQVQINPDEEFEATASTAMLTITSNTGWTIEISVPWIKVSNRTGSGNDSRTVEIEPNIDDRRTGYIMVKTTNGLQKEIEINQRTPTTLQYRLVLGMNNMSISVGETMSNTAKFYATINGHEYLINQDVSTFADWSSSNEPVAVVQAGDVTGISYGQAEIWATYKGTKSQDCYVNVQ